MAAFTRREARPPPFLPELGRAAPPRPTAQGFDSPLEALPDTAARSPGLNGGRRGAKRDTGGAGPREARGHERLALPGA